MARYTDADKALKRIKDLQETDPATVGKKQFTEGFFLGLDEAELVLMQTPTADVVEVKHARWIEESSLYVHCSNCRTREYPREHNFKSKVCPECGAKMDGKPQKEV